MSWRDRFARRQVSDDEITEKNMNNGTTSYNIWYNKSINSDSDMQSSGRFVNKFKLDVKRDSGKTVADSNCNKFCLFFARGCCQMGKNCTFWHHVPESDELKESANVDCFGREKYNTYRDDMSGVGSMHARNDTLYIGGITQALNDKILKPVQIESRLKFMFNELGLLSKLRYVENKNCAFVTFKSAVNAEFAKEVMSNQTLLLPRDPEWPRRLEGSGLLVKWANEDPDRNAKRQRERDSQSRNLQLMEQILKQNEIESETEGVTNTKTRKQLDQKPLISRTSRGKINKLQTKFNKERKPGAKDLKLGEIASTVAPESKAAVPLVNYSDSSDEE